MSSVTQLNNLTSNLVLYVTSTCLVLGVIGLSLNCILLTRRIFLNNPCALYFLASTFANLVIITLNSPLTLIKYIGNIDIPGSHVYLCKFFRYTFWMFRSLSLWLIVLASIDRYFNSSSNVNIRLYSSFKNAKRSILIITILIVILYSHMLIYYQLFSTMDSNGNISWTCNPQAGFYGIFAAFLHFAMYSCIPIILMFIFGILTLINIRKQRRVIVQMNRNGLFQRQNIKLNNQLCRMLFIQILVITLSTVPLSVQRIYESWTSNIIKSPYAAAQDRFFVQVTQAFSYLAHSTSFYFYTLSGIIFRQELKRLFNKFIIYFYFIDNNNITQLPVQHFH